MFALTLPKNALTGISEARQGNTTKGSVLLEQALKETDDPVVQAWYGYCIAREGRNYSRALQLCLNALRRSPDNADICLALGRLYLCGKSRMAAINVLQKGLRLGGVPEIGNLLESIGVRKRPVFPFLPRNNPLNVASGRVLSRLGWR